MVIEPYRVPCYGESLQACYLVSEDGGNFELLYDGVDGLDYVWGHRYEATVRVSDVRNPPADGSSLRYTIITIDSDVRAPAGEEFELNAEAAVVGDAQADGAFSLLGEIDFSCSDDAVCDELVAQIEADTPTLAFTFAFPADDETPLDLVSVRAAGQ